MRPDLASQSPAYRPDIDGLRAVAVLLVIGFHAFPGAVPGGFIGVDVFFVISGFLITSLIAQELDTGRFSLVQFYARRARRIFPALFVVLLACLVAGYFLLLPADYRALGADAAWSAAFVANIALFFQAGYFDAASETKPLLHLWSLGIEEQFYIVWPLLLLLAAPRKWMRQVALAALFASFACNIALSAADPTAAFYLPMSRVWELAAGAVLALTRYRSQSHGRHEVAAWTGAALLFAAVVLIGPDSLFPGWWALMPVSATVLLILAGPTTRINCLLSHRTLVAIGLISYPLYLWHWPVLVFARIARFGAEPPILMKLVLIGASFALAYATWRWIERPIRFGRSSPLKPIGASVGLAAAASAGVAISIQAGLPARFDSGIQHLVKDFQAEASRAYRTGTCFLNDTQSTAFAPDCVSTTPTADRLVLLWGDSYAAHLFPGLAELQGKMKFGLAEYASSGCPPIMGFASTQRANCEAINAFVMDRIEALKPQTVIVAGRWNLYNGEHGWGTIERTAVQATIARLAASGVARIVVVGQFPAWSLAPSRILLRSHQLGLLKREPGRALQIREHGTDHLDQKAFAVEDIVRRHWSAPHVVFISPRATLCHEAGCRLIAPGDPPQPIAWDHGHLTVTGSAYFVAANAEQLLGP